MRIIDSHTHLGSHNPQKLLQMVDHFGYEKYGVMAILTLGMPANHPGGRTVNDLLLDKIHYERF